MGNKDAIIEAFTEMAPKYEETVDGELQRFWGWSYAGFIENLIDLTPMREDDLVLDIATGTAVIPLKLIQRGKRRGRIIGLDITLAMLEKARAKLAVSPAPEMLRLTCASAMGMPYRSSLFDVVLCGLATHHLDVPLLLAEMARVLKPGGQLTIADVGGARIWRNPLVAALIRSATFVYFLFREGAARAISEAGALSNVYTAEEWRDQLLAAGFTRVSVVELPSRHAWSPAPLLMRATQDAKGEG